MLTILTVVTGLNIADIVVFIAVCFVAVMTDIGVIDPVKRALPNQYRYLTLHHEGAVGVVYRWDG